MVDDGMLKRAKSVRPSNGILGDVMTSSLLAVRFRAPGQSSMRAPIPDEPAEFPATQEVLHPRVGGAGMVDAGVRQATNFAKEGLEVSHLAVELVTEQREHVVDQRHGDGHFGWLADDERNTSYELAFFSSYEHKLEKHPGRIF